MSRCGPMELMFQGARAVGSDVGTPGPIRSLESIPELVDDEKHARVCVRSGPESRWVF